MLARNAQAVGDAMKVGIFVIHTPAESERWSERKDAKAVGWFRYRWRRRAAVGAHAVRVCAISRSEFTGLMSEIEIRLHAIGANRIRLVDRDSPPIPEPTAVGDAVKKL